MTQLREIKRAKTLLLKAALDLDLNKHSQAIIYANRA